MAHRGMCSIALVAALGLLTAGCSSDEASSPTVVSGASASSAPTTEPTTEPAASAADTTEPATSGVVTTEPAETDPDATEPATTDPATTDPATTDPQTTETDTAETSTSDAATTTSPPTLAAADVPAVASAGCSAAPHPAGESTIPFTGAGQPGSYILHVPASGGTSPIPLVFDLHGYSEPAAVHLLQSGLAASGDVNGFVTVLPQIDRPVPRWDSTVGSPDVAFISDLLDELEGTLCIDTNRIFVAGLSNGAFMTSILACDLSDRIAAAAPVAGIQAPVECAPVRSVPVISFHGTADTFVAYDGGLGASVATLPSADGSGTLGTGATATNDDSDVVSVPERTSAWAVRNGCDPTPAEEEIAADVTLLRFDCPPGDEVLLYRVEGGGHSWPGSAFSQQIASIVGATTTSIDATALIWAFFAEHPLRP